MAREHLCPLCRTTFASGGEVIQHVLHEHPAEVHALPPRKRRAKPKKRKAAPKGA